MNQRNAEFDIDHDVTAHVWLVAPYTSLLTSWGVADGSVQTLQLLVSELVSNAVLHGDGPIHMAVSEKDPAAGLVRVEVHNGGEMVPVMRRAHRDDLSGRGLRLIDELSRGWGTHCADGRTMVWLRSRPTLPNHDIVVRRG